jgi:hypothetical protein
MDAAQKCVLEPLIDPKYLNTTSSIFMVSASAAAKMAMLRTAHAWWGASCGCCGGSQVVRRT